MPSDAFHHLIAAIGNEFAAEGRPGGDEAAAAAQEITSTRARPEPGALPDHAETLGALIDASAHPLARRVRAAFDDISWHYSGLADGRIRPEMARHMLTAELAGPDGQVHHPTVRLGLFFQMPGLNYVTREHAAEETFVMIAGGANWTVADETTHRQAGEASHHPSMVPHSSATGASAVLAVWRWTGEISYGRYRLTG